MTRLLREPLLHFVVLGAALFGLNALLSDDAVAAEDGEIVVTGGQIESLVARFVRIWQRSPSAEELKTLVDDYVLEQALYREGVAMGLDRDDTIVRRRLRQKVEFALIDLVDQAEPTEQEMEEWLAAHPGSYSTPARYTFCQVFLDPNRRGDTARDDAAEVLAALREKAKAGAAFDAREFGDATLLEHAHRGVAADIVARTFGPAFVKGLDAPAIGAWSGPISSTYGLHLVRIDAREAGALRPLAEVRDDVLRDVVHARREAATARFHREMLSRYRISVEWPAADPGAEPAGDAGAEQQK